MPKGFIPLNEDGSPKDISKDSTSQEIRDSIGQDSGTTLSSKLSDIWNKLVELFNTGVAKVKIWDGTEVADVIVDDTINRLAVDANVTGGVTLQRFTLIVDYDVSDIVLNTSTDTVLKTVTGDGRLDFISIDSSSANYEVILEIDSVEIMRISMNDLGSNLGLANASNVPIWVETANKNFRLHPNAEGMDFTSNFTIKAKATSGTPSLTWLVKYRTIV